ncbi:MAG TPA: nuclear transport factor 2 family protein [Acidimicrobiales bacterium]|jgi:hypothetical protein|nr:nuclear transport factor 2 family protein [Acidimicrobiales bacterium]
MIELDVLLAERAITRVLHQYAHAVDRRLYPQIRACYWDDGYDDHTSFSGTVPDYCAWLEEVLPQVDTSTHQFTNVLIDVDLAAGRATSEAYCLNVTVWGPRADGTARHLTSALRYLDSWARRGDEWRILNRRCVSDWRRVEDVVVGD